MAFKHICNNPEERSKITYSWKVWSELFNEAELNTLNDYLSTLDMQRATTQEDIFLAQNTHTQNQNNNTNTDIRVSSIKFLTLEPETEWIFTRFNWVIEQINHYFYGYDLNGYDSIQYGVYDSTELGRYGWHMDTHMNDRVDGYFETRKLSLSFLLNEPGLDFEGGEFQLNSGTAEAQADTLTLKKGDLVAFSSFLLHRVAPVTRGIRKSLVIWVTGPKFK
jgi:PKHD-type hydroxylase